jgi:hemerythrin
VFQYVDQLPLKSHTEITGEALVGGTDLPLIKFGNKQETAGNSVIKWEASYSVNIAEIDQQHQMLIAMINELSDSVSQSKGREVQEKVLNGLASYAKEHFATEERYFDKYAYPWSVTHKAEHAAFTQKVVQFVQDYQAGKAGLNNQILSFLSDWLKNHIIGKDKTYSYFFTMKGLK